MTMNRPITNGPSFFSIAEDPWEGSMSHLLRLSGFNAGSVEEAEIIIFNGGADIGTEIYGEMPVLRGIPEHRSIRDRNEIAVFDRYKNSGKLFVGICRGGQLLNCLNGGTLWQDVNNHGRNHSMTIVETGEKIRITSTHHQMMRPNWDKAKLIAVADESTQKVAEKDNWPHGTYQDDHKDTEIVWYRDTNSLCIQGHPEYVPGSTFAEYCIKLIHEYLAEAKNVKAA